MERFIKSIRHSLESENWFAALFISLAMPDICGALETPEARNGERYKRWFNENLKHKYHFGSQFEVMCASSPELIEIITKDHRLVNYVQKLKSTPANESTNFTAEDCYAFRNACIHSGMSKDKKRKFALIPPPPSGICAHRNNSEGALQLQIDILCEDICEAVELWTERVSDNKEIANRISELIEIKLENLPFVIFQDTN